MTSSIALTVRQLTHSAFAPYGDIVQPDGAKSFMINNGTTERFHDLTKVDVADEEGAPLINIFRGRAFHAPIEIKMLERHPLGSQAFIPLSPHPWLIVVARAGETGAPGVPEAFFAESHQGVNYRKGVWHHPLIALQKTCDFLVVDRGGEGGNLEEADLPGEGYIIENLHYSGLR